LNVEIFPCSGGMAEGFRRAGILFDLAVDKDLDACDSYEENLGHRPLQMDARDFLRLAKLGARLPRIRLFVADPPCTPWSRAGKRLGVQDERDMLHVTCELIELLKPDAYLIGNVPGLEDSTQWHHLQAALAPLAKVGYCIADFATLDAADYGVPQHRVRPFWFGHLSGPCIQWPMPTHCDPGELLAGSLGLHALKPWVTCRDALGHLSLEQLGRPCRLRKRAQNSAQHGSVEDKPARVVGVSNLSDGNVLLNPRHPPAQPARTLGAKERCQSSVLLLDTEGHPQPKPDEPSPTIRGGGSGHSAPQVVLALEPKANHPISQLDAPSMVVRTNGGRVAQAGSMLELPERLELRNQPPLDPEEPVRTVTANGRGHQAMLAVRPHHDTSSDNPARTQSTKQDDARLLDWPWSRPGTTVTHRGLGVPGHHDEEHRSHSGPNAVVLSELAGTILQGFPEDWCFSGKTKRSRWSQRGQAMPPPLAEAVACSVGEQMRRADEETQRANEPNGVEQEAGSVTPPASICFGSVA